MQHVLRSSTGWNNSAVGYPESEDYIFRIYNSATAIHSTFQYICKNCVELMSFIFKSSTVQTFDWNWSPPAIKVPEYIHICISGCDLFICIWKTTKFYLFYTTYLDKWQFCGIWYYWDYFLNCSGTLPWIYSRTNHTHCSEQIRATSFRKWWHSK